MKNLMKHQVYYIKIIKLIKIFLGPGTYELHTTESIYSSVADLVKVSHHQTIFNNIHHLLFALFFFFFLNSIHVRIHLDIIVNHSRLQFLIRNLHMVLKKMSQENLYHNNHLIEMLV